MPLFSLLLTLLFVVERGAGLPTYAQGPGDIFIRDGIVNLKGLTGTVFQVIDYMPVCGTLSASLTQQSDLSDKCTAAMIAFNATNNAATAAIYDITGVASSEKPGGGNQLCICGSYGTASAKPGDPKSNGLLCVWVDEHGTEEIWWSGSTDNRVASSFQMSAQGKSLPHCDKVDLASMSKASQATRTAEVASPASTAKSGSAVTTTAKLSQSTGESQSNNNNPNNSKPNNGSKIGPIVGGVIGGIALLAIIIGVVVCLLRSKRKEKRLVGGSVSGSSAWAASDRGRTGEWVDKQAGNRWH